MLRTRRFCDGLTECCPYILKTNMCVKNLESRHKCTRVLGLDAEEVYRLRAATNSKIRSTLPITATAGVIAGALCTLSLAPLRSLSFQLQSATGHPSLFPLSMRHPTAITNAGIRDGRSIARFLAPPVSGY